MTRQTLRWPDATALTLDYLRASLGALSTTTYPSLTGLTLHQRVPSPLVRPFLRVSRVGGIADQTHDRPRLFLESWADLEEIAHDNVALARDVLRDIPGVRGGFTVSAFTEVGGPADLADPQTGAPRYVLTFSLLVRALPRT